MYAKHVQYPVSLVSEEQFKQRKGNLKSQLKVKTFIWHNTSSWLMVMDRAWGQGKEIGCTNKDMHNQSEMRA